MNWNDVDLKIIIALVGVFTALVGAITALITARWNRKAVVSEEALGALKQQVELLKQQATTTETHLKEQIAYYRELSPADIQKQLQALKLLLSDRIIDLERKLDESNSLLRDKSSEVADQKLSVATAMAYGRLFFGINDAELFVRSLTELLTGGRYKMIDFGEVDLNIKAFYVGIMRIMIRNDDFILEFTSKSPEYVLDHVVMPLLACCKYRALRPRISETLKIVFDKMDKTPFASEVPIYREALERAEQGHNFDDLRLPVELAIRLSK